MKLPLGRNQLPPESPLPFPTQDFTRPFIDPTAPQRLSNIEPNWLRVGVMLATILLTLTFTHQMAVFHCANGLTTFEGLTLVFYVLTFVWIAFASVNALLGAVKLICGTDSPRPGRTRPLTVALLVLSYREPPARVFGNATAMLSNLAEVESRHSYDLFVLSDTTGPEMVEEEQAAFRAARELLEADCPLYYRRRSQNTNRKVGNIADWVCRWGGAYEAFVVLDSDSVMSARAIHALTDELARDETLSLVQSAPRIIGARTLFGRIQQFSSAAVGPVVAAGAACWMGDEANYFGHNAIIRTRAFAASAHLPALLGKPPLGGNILSHDFVEAALLRRAGWGVRSMPLKDGSYEETPPSIIDHVLRDRRWCQGNLQHLLVLTSAGFHPLNRFHLLQGIMAYLVSPFWALFLLFGMAALFQKEGYLGEAGLVPAGGEAVRGLTVLIGTLLILIAPKFLGAISLIVVDKAKLYGSKLKLFASIFVEVVLMSMFAPILMVQQTISVVRVTLGIDGGWHPQQREVAERTWIEHFRFHSTETILGASFVICIVAGLLTSWLWPIALSLLFAAPLSRLSSSHLGNTREQPLLFATPEDVVQPAILAQSRRHAQRISERIGPGAAPPQMLQAAE